VNRVEKELKKIAQMDETLRLMKEFEERLKAIEDLLQTLKEKLS